MAVTVTVIGEENLSDEYITAVRLKNIITKYMPATAIGDIKILPSVTLYGQDTKDVDILLIGQLSNYSVSVSFEHNGFFSKEQVSVEGFCTTIEIKSHSISGIQREGTNWLVRYGDNWHNVTKQSNDQKYAVKNFFDHSFGESPYITNLIWFVGITDDELNNLEKTTSGLLQSNVLPAMYTLEDMFQLLAWQRLPKFYRNRYHIDCSFGAFDTDKLIRPIMNFFKAKAGMGELTRRKIEQITQKQLSALEENYQNGHFTILRGRAGTGKTIALLQMGIHIVDDFQKRALILTYNRALVADIRRLLALSDLPDMFEAQCLSVSTMQSYFFGIINCCLYNGNLNGNDFLKRYDAYLQEMCDFIRSDSEAIKMVKEICREDQKLFWDYILIDEAQDWTNTERDLILLLFDKDHVFVADGGQQFVRQIEPCDWTVVPDRKNIKLKYCLRQKDNLIHFINAVYCRFGISGNKILSPNTLPGGNVIIVQGENRIESVVKEEYKKLCKNENSPYDLLIITPPSLVVTTKEGKRFKYLDNWEKNGILLWDGTNDSKRLDYPTDPRESRVVQYDSARGLEGWTVVCLNFDEFLDYKSKTYVPKNNSLMLESEEEKEKRYLADWAMVPLTRAIDTLIINLANPESRFSLDLLNLAEDYPDFMSVI